MPRTTPVSFSTADEIAAVSPAASRNAIAVMQHALLEALAQSGPLPEPFESKAVAATSLALRRKRARNVRARFPAYPLAHGPKFLDDFAHWAEGKPLADAGTAADLVRFDRETRRGPLPMAAAMALLDARLGAGGRLVLVRATRGVPLVGLRVLGRTFFR